MTEPQPQPRRAFRAPHWAGYIVVAIVAFLLGAVMDTGEPNCGGLAAAETVTTATLNS